VKLIGAEKIRAGVPRQEKKGRVIAIEIAPIMGENATQETEPMGENFRNRITPIPPKKDWTLNFLK
jgi:hypothetical protein